MTAQTTNPAPSEATQETAIDLFACTIARSRYEAWEGNATGVSWDDYRVQNPVVASNIYLEDGRRDALALLPIVQGAINQAAVRALNGAVAQLALGEQVAAAGIVEAMAARLDWTRQGGERS